MFVEWVEGLNTVLGQSETVIKECVCGYNGGTAEFIIDCCSDE